MKDQDCIFCKIANGEIPGATLYEDDRFRVILDLSPASKGHALILPKEHFENLFAIPDEWLSDAFILAKKIAAREKEILRCDGINIIQNNGPAAGQTVFHFHIHLIPRWEGDGVGLGWKQGTLTDAVRDELVSGFAQRPVQ